MQVRRIEAVSRHQRLRAAAYCRVSTDRDEQEESYEKQIAYYTELICGNPNWTFAGIYADHGKSGTDAKKRPDFQRMMRDALGISDESGKPDPQRRKIDLIFVKSISRFSRNMVDCDRAVKELKAVGVEVRFEKENISSFDPTAGFVFSLLAAVAQDESRSISENVRWRYANRFAKGDYNIGSNRILGYDSADGKLVPNRDATAVKRIFELYTQGKSPAEIGIELAKNGFLGMRTHRPMTSASIQSILRNETYTGDKRLQKNPPLDYLTKKPDPNVEHVSYYLKDDHEAIIDRAAWEQAQEMLKRKQEEANQGIYKHGEQHPLYGKLFCGLCGAPYKRRTLRECSARGGESYKAWNCRERQKGKGGNGCRNRIVREIPLTEEVERQTSKKVDATALEDIDRILVYEDRIKVVPK